MKGIKEVVEFIREIYKTPSAFIPLHEPRFVGKEREYVLDAIDSTFVSSVGKYVDRFEEEITKYTGAKYAVACVNGTAALHMSLIVAGVQKDDLVITQPLSFIATCNAISYLGAAPVFVDVDRDTLGFSPDSLEAFLKQETVKKEDGLCYHKKSNKKIAACVPMHTFGFPARIDRIKTLCEEFGIPLIEDAAESIGSKYKDKHTGTFGLLGAFSFNGNKTITCGGGGVIITNDERLAKLAKHLTTQAKVPHKWEFDHDYIGYNYRMPNLNAAFACAQLERLDEFVDNKRELSLLYSSFFESSPFKFVTEPADAKSNYWLNAVLLKDVNERDAFLTYTNEAGVMTRPVWKLNNKLKMFKDSIASNLDNAEWIEERLVNIPSSVRVR